jgi:MerR family transcriptional regulator, thiopeptide resistance regulator
VLAEAMMNENGHGTRLYHIQEFAELAGVTVRALHHYDRLGLLKPAARTASKYRLYADNDLVRLEQIVVLKFLGMPLKEIGLLLKKESALGDALRRQQHVLSEKRQQLDHAIRAIADAEASIAHSRDPDWKLFRKIIQEIEMQNNTEWSKQYYSEDAKKKIEERKALWNPEMQEQVTKDWNQLFADIEKSLDEDPSSPRAQELAGRWKALLSGFTGGDPEIQKGLNKMYADRDNWPAEQQERYSIRPEIWGFIQKAFNAGSHS